MAGELADLEYDGEVRIVRYKPRAAEPQRAPDRGGGK